MSTTRDYFINWTGNTPTKESGVLNSQYIRNKIDAGCLNYDIVEYYIPTYFVDNDISVFNINIGSYAISKDGDKIYFCEQNISNNVNYYLDLNTNTLNFISGDTKYDGRYITLSPNGNMYVFITASKNYEIIDTDTNIVSAFTYTTDVSQLYSHKHYCYSNNKMFISPYGSNETGFFTYFDLDTKDMVNYPTDISTYPQIESNILAPNGNIYNINKNPYNSFYINTNTLESNYIENAITEGGYYYACSSMRDNKIFLLSNVNSGNTYYYLNINTNKFESYTSSMTGATSLKSMSLAPDGNIYFINTTTNTICYINTSINEIFDTNLNIFIYNNINLYSRKTTFLSNKNRLYFLPQTNFEAECKKEGTGYYKLYYLQFYPTETLDKSFYSYNII